LDVDTDHLAASRKSRKKHVPSLVLDHITVTAPTLADGVRHVRDHLGVDVPQGGAHLQMGTHNHLMRLGADEFLEIISVNPVAPAPSRPRWFALDAEQPRPRLATWVLRTADLNASLAKSGVNIGEPTMITRGSLSWMISVPADGSMPYGGAHPTFIMWPMTPPPGANMPNLRCRLVRLTIEHPSATEIKERLRPVFSDKRVHLIEGPTLRLTAEIETPSGTRVLQ
jgi:hypothetical protein